MTLEGLPGTATARIPRTIAIGEMLPDASVMKHSNWMRDVASVVDVGACGGEIVGHMSRIRSARIRLFNLVDMPRARASERLPAMAVGRGRAPGKMMKLSCQ